MTEITRLMGSVCLLEPNLITDYAAAEIKQMTINLTWGAAIRMLLPPFVDYKKLGLRN